MLKKAIIAATAISAPGIGLTVLSERLIRPHLFYTGAWNPDPPDVLGVRFEEAQIYTADGLELQGWYFPCAKPDAPTLLFMHGTSYNASDIWVSADRVEAFRQFLAGIGANFFVFDYRGYGRRGGTATEDGTYLDAAAALAWLHNRGDIDPAKIFFYGYSLGTGIASELAMREPSAGLILRAPFTSIRDMAVLRRPRIRAVFRLAPWLPLTNYDTLSKIRRLDRPLLVMHGDADETVPEWMGQRVFEAAPEPKRYVSFPNGGHRDFATELVVPAITQFIDSVLGHTREKLMPHDYGAV